MDPSPKSVVRASLEAFNAADADRLAALDREDATNHRVAFAPVTGHAAIRATFAAEFARATMVCVPENLFEDGDWAILEWSDPLGLRGCGVFRVEGGLTAFQRGDFDRLSFLEAQGLPPDDRFVR